MLRYERQEDIPVPLTKKRKSKLRKDLGFFSFKVDKRTKKLKGIKGKLTGKHLYRGFNSQS